MCTAPECGFLCPHMYRCDPLCYEYNNGHVCKHIHRIHSLEKNPDLGYCHNSDPDTDIEISYAESVFNPKKG